VDQAEKELESVGWARKIAVEAPRSRSKLQRSFKIQSPRQLSNVQQYFGVWNLARLWKLDVGAWTFEEDEEAEAEEEWHGSTVLRFHHPLLGSEGGFRPPILHGFFVSPYQPAGGFPYDPLVRRPRREPQ
jgi:hypothetical protein